MMKPNKIIVPIHRKHLLALFIVLISVVLVPVSGASGTSISLGPESWIVLDHYDYQQWWISPEGNIYVTEDPPYVFYEWYERITGSPYPDIPQEGLPDKIDPVPFAGPEEVPVTKLPSSEGWEYCEITELPDGSIDYTDGVKEHLGNLGFRTTYAPGKGTGVDLSLGRSRHNNSQSCYLAGFSQEGIPLAYRITRENAREWHCYQGDKYLQDIFSLLVAHDAFDPSEVPLSQLNPGGPSFPAPLPSQLPPIYSGLVIKDGTLDWTDLMKLHLRQLGFSPVFSNATDLSFNRTIADGIDTVILQGTSEDGTTLTYVISRTVGGEWSCEQGKPFLNDVLMLCLGMSVLTSEEAFVFIPSDLSQGDSRFEGIDRFSHDPFSRIPLNLTDIRSTAPAGLIEPVTSPLMNSSLMNERSSILSAERSLIERNGQLQMKGERTISPPSSFREVTSERRAAGGGR